MKSFYNDQKHVDFVWPMKLIPLTNWSETCTTTREQIEEQIVQKAIISSTTSCQQWSLVNQIVVTAMCLNRAISHTKLTK